MRSAPQRPFRGHRATTRLVASAALLAILLSCTGKNVEKGNSCLRLGDYIMAREFFGRELARNPASFEARLGMGKSLLQQAVDADNDTSSWRQALIHLEAARTLSPSTEILPLLSQAWSTHARNLLLHRDTIASLGALSRAVEYDPRSVESLNLAGIIYYRIGDSGRSRALFLTALAIDSTHPSAHFNLGMIHWQKGESMDAHEHWLAALKSAPEDEDILYWFALSEKKLRESLGK